MPPTPDLTSILDDLREAARYAHGHPDEAVRLANRAMYDLLKAMRPKERTWSNVDLYHRLRENVNSGCHLVRCCPDVLRGYCLGACVELENWAAKQRKGD